MRKPPATPYWMLSQECCRALLGWPIEVAPCCGYIESDYAPGTFYPCATCNPDWSRVATPLPARPA